jgi:uncharacterized membrane protein YsdA (DUF1294 family)
MTTALALTCLAALVVVAALLTLLLDRSAQVRAWRRIAEERRWNHDRSDIGS